MRPVFFLLVLLYVGLLGCNKKLTPHEGYVNVEGGRIWYKVMGSGKKTPLLLIHGGPGGKSCSFIPAFNQFEKGRPVIIYDQLGSGRSDPSPDTALWNLPRFINEVDSLRAALGLKNLHILGQSWGGTVLVEYLISKNPTGIKSAIFASPLISTPVWMQDAKILLSQLSKNLQDTINKYESLKIYDSPSYAAATDSFYAKHLSVKQWPRAPLPECLGTKSNESIYNYMWGSTEFNATGTLKNYDRETDLENLKMPVLFITGEFDEARPETIFRFRDKVKGSQAVIIKNAGHSLQTDNPEDFIQALRKFIKETE